MASRKSINESRIHSRGQSYNDSEDSRGDGVALVLVLLAGLIAIVPLFQLHYPLFYQEHDQAMALEDIVKAISNITEKFPSQSKELWGGILSVLSIEICPRSILLLNREDEKSRATSRCLVSMVANSSAALLPFEAQVPLTLKDSDFLDIEETRSKVKQHGTVLIETLDTFSVQSAHALHFFCDEYEKNFAKAVYFLTLTVPSTDKKASKAAEAALQTLWPAMDKENYDALIARITSRVYFVEPETSIHCDR